MARELFAIEKGLHILGEDLDSGVRVLFGTAIPGLLVQETDAEVGSVYFRNDGTFYTKETAGSGIDKWLRAANNNDLQSIKFRSEKVLVGTGDVAPITGASIDLVASPFGDDDVPTVVAADFAIDDHVIFGIGGTPKIMRVSAIAAPSITLVDADRALTDGDKHLVRKYLPDSAGQENQALVQYDGTNTTINKIADIDWAFATGISLSSGYTPGSGNITSVDTVESAIEKLDGNVDAVNTSMGIAQGATDMGTYTGTILTDNASTKTNIQELETAVDGIVLGNQVTLPGVTSIVTLDSVLADDAMAVKWLVTARLDSDPTRVKSFEFFAHHDGHAGADATKADDTKYAKLRIGAGFNFSISADVSGAGAAQQLRLRVGAAAAVTVNAVRVEVVRF